MLIIGGINAQANPKKDCLYIALMFLLNNRQARNLPSENPIRIDLNNLSG
ncbi:hypothetical protein MARINOS108_50011 [Marinoscillum sp. 108]|nr:hypothetical protein MARINOS108_50011 [Marinoscillum sp. 108]